MLRTDGLTQIVTTEQLGHKSGSLLPAFFNESALLSDVTVLRLGCVNLITIAFLRLSSLKLIVASLRHLQVVLTLAHFFSWLTLLMLPLLLLLRKNIAKVKAVLLHLLALVVARSRVSQNTESSSLALNYSRSPTRGFQSEKLVI